MSFIKREQYYHVHGTHITHEGALNQLIRYTTSMSCHYFLLNKFPLQNPLQKSMEDLVDKEPYHVIQLCPSSDHLCTKR